MSQQNAQRSLNAQTKELANKVRNLDIPMAPVRQKQDRAKVSFHNTASSSGDWMNAKSPVRASSQSSVRNVVQSSNTVTSLGFKLFSIIEYLKSCDEPQSESQIKQSLSTLDLNDDQIWSVTQQNAKILYQNGAYQYKPAFSARSKEELLHVIRDLWKQNKGGIHYKEFKDSWRGIPDAIEQLCSNNEIIVTRLKDGRPHILYYNDMPQVKLNQYPAFEQLWHEYSVKEGELGVAMQEMEKAGLSLLQLSESQQAAGGGPQNNKKKSRKGRLTKITNTHLKDIDLTVDYKPPSDIKTEKKS
ncbi:hypothetical protein MP228_009892 [Amoeboaphelidium protococcarum]|nr:hypothetical protein MP228_009892 [Amoeboaphelidium protococcarum]